jgi:Flavin containing amine oxidoreductase
MPPPAHDVVVVERRARRPRGGLARARSRRGGSLMICAAADLPRAVEDLDDDAIGERFRESFYPELGELVTETRSRWWPVRLPQRTVGGARLQPALTRPRGRIHLAGAYLGSWSTETAAHTGEAASEAARLTASATERAR